METFNLLFCEKSPFLLLNPGEEIDQIADYYMDFIRNMLSNNKKLRHFTFNMGHHSVKTSSERAQLQIDVEDLNDQLDNELDPEIRS